MRPTALERALFDDLVGRSGEALASLYLPTHVKGAEVDQDRIRLKNGLARVDEMLETLGWRPPARRARLEAVRRLLDDQEFWAHQGLGLAVFIDDRSSTVVALPEPVAELWVVSDVFHVRPLLGSLDPIELPVLALTLDRLRLYRSSRYRTAPVEADLPDSFDDVNWFVDREKQRQQRPDRTRGTQAGHGHDPAMRRHEDLDRFLRAVDDAIPDGAEPLIVLGDDTIVSRFRHVSARDVVSADGRVRDVDDIAAVHAVASVIVGRHRSELDRESIELAVRALGSGAATSDLDESLRAALSGRMSRLVLNAGAVPRWGRFDPSTGTASLHGDRATLDVDLLDRQAVRTLATGADVEPVDEPIDGHDFVAVMRF